MSETNYGGSNLKQRYKRVEHFLRRVAFNLGNTPSQTEVKIISCIPVDVTDLQQKICHLQKELEDAKASSSNKKLICPAKTTCCHTVCQTTCSTCNSRNLRPRTTSRRRCKRPNEELSYSNDVYSTGSSRHTDLSTSHQKSSGSAMNMSQSSRNSSITDRGKCKSRCWKKFLKKKLASNKKCKTQFVYCAQTDRNTPFYKTFSLSDDLTSKFYREDARRGHFSDELTSQNFSKQATKSDTLSRSYVEQMVQKQYKPQLIINGFSNLSEFSSPICRDNMTNCLPYESEICSCCHDSFQDVDKHMNRGSNFLTYPTCDNDGNNIRNTYYDSNLYDLVPVKEKTVKIRNDTVTPKRKDRSSRTIKCWPEKARPKYRVPSRVINTCSVATAQDFKRRNPHAKLLSRKDLVVNKMASKSNKFNLPRPEKDDIDIGQIYTKQVTRHRKLRKQNNSSTVTRMRNVGTSSPTTLKNTDCQTATATVNENWQSDPGTPKDKTETTLNQIKDILQSVLTEVKTNSKLTTSVELAKKDANVQNGPTQGYEFGGSHMLHSYSYSPYNIEPYLATCSHHLASNTYTSFPEYPGFQPTPLQHYPLLINPQKHMCNNCLRNSHFSKMINTKRAASAATNTDHHNERSKETERLIKEIYNSMALTFEMPSEVNASEYTKPKSTVEKSIDSVKIGSAGESKRAANAISEIFRNKHPHESSTLATNTATTLFSNLDQNERKFKSRSTVKKERSHKRMHSQKYNSTTETMYMETEQNSRELVTEEQTDSNIINEETEESSSDSGTPDTVDAKKPVLDTKKEKSGIFKKMLKIFQLKQRERKQRGAVKTVENETGSDSDDYQTVYSHKVSPPQPKNVVDMRIRPRSKVIFYSKHPQQRKARAKTPEKHSRPSPYMEQEYRRYWDEKLMFHDNKRRRYSTDISRDTCDYRKQKRPVYYQNYEARAVLVNPTRPAPITNYTNYDMYERNKRYVPTPINNYTNNDTYERNKRYVPVYRARPYIGNNQHYEKVVQVVNSSNSAATVTGGNRHGKPHYIISKSSNQRRSVMAAKGLAWMKKHTMCQQWKDLIRDS